MIERGKAAPATAIGAAAADAAAAADPILPSPSGRGAGGEGEGDATDADIARWILDAASLYEACCARIDAIRQWDEVTYGR
jgi:prophage endopeptidase